MSADTAKEVQNDKTLKTKNEKDRRLREKRQNNVKRFMEEKKVGSVQFIIPQPNLILISNLYSKSVLSRAAPWRN